MSKYVIVGDPHAKPSNLAQMDALFRMIEDIGFPVIWLGDLLDTKEVVRGSCLNTYLEYFQGRGARVEHIVLVGNHDYFNLECKDHSLQPLKLLSNVTVVDAPWTHDGMLLLPYTHKSVELRKALADNSGFPIMIGHLEVSGFDFGNGHICEEGLSLEDFKDFDLVVSGHFHKYQKTGNLVYLGTPFSHSFGESNQQKYLAILDSETGELEYLPTPFPQHLTFEVDCDLPTPMDLSYNQNNHNRVILTGRAENIARVEKDKYPHVKFIERPRQELEGELSISETASNEEKFLLWCEGRKIARETVLMGLEVMRKVAG